MTKALYSVMF